MSEETKLIGGNANTDKTVKLTQKSKIGKLFAKYSKTAAGYAGGAATVVGVFGLMGLSKPDPLDETGNPAKLPKPEIPDEPKEATTVSEEMSFSEAFAAARTEVGATGYFTWHGKVFNPIYEGEVKQLNIEEQTALYKNTMHQWTEQNHQGTDQKISGEAENLTNNEPVIVIHDNAPVSHAVNEDMSFRDAFANARADVGPGGTFTWHGKEYSTYSDEEWNGMSNDEQHQFYASSEHTEVNHPAISQNDVDIVNIDNSGSATVVQPASDNSNSDMTATNDFGEGNLISEEYVSDGQGGTMHVGLFEVNGQTIIRADTDGDGNYDTQLIPDGNGNMIMENQAGEQTLITQDDIQQAQQTVEATDNPIPVVYAQDVLPDSDFNPDASGMDEWAH